MLPGWRIATPTVPVGRHPNATMSAPERRPTSERTLIGRAASWRRCLGPSRWSSSPSGRTPWRSSAEVGSRTPRGRSPRPSWSPPPIYAIGDVAGAHLNPVASLAFALKRLIPVSWLLPYWAAQLTGALLAALLVRVLFGDLVRAGVSTPHVPDATALTIEAVLTLLLVAVILGTADRNRIVGPDAALAVGATIALAGLIALPIDGASMNPARSLGPALVAGDLQHVWIYVVGPLLGGLLAVPLTRFLHGRVDSDLSAEEAAQGT